MAGLTAYWTLTLLADSSNQDALRSMEDSSMKMCWEEKDLMENRLMKFHWHDGSNRLYKET